MDNNLLTIIAIIGGLLLIPALVAGRVLPQLSGQWPARLRYILAAAGGLLCCTGFAAGWITWRSEYRSLEQEASISALLLPETEREFRLEDPAQVDFLVTLVLRDQLRGDEPILLEQTRISLQSTVRGSIKSLAHGKDRFTWRVMINPPRSTGHRDSESDQPVWSVVGTSAFVPRGQDPVRGGSPFGFALSPEKPYNQFTVHLEQRQPAFGYLVAGDRRLAATMIFEPFQPGTVLREVSAQAVLERYGYSPEPLKMMLKPSAETAETAFHLARYLNVAAVPFGVGVLLLSLGFIRHRALAMAGMAAAVLLGIALNERAALAAHLQKAADPDAPVSVRVTAIHHAGSVFFWQGTAAKRLRSLAEDEGTPEELNKILFQTEAGSGRIGSNGGGS